MSIPGGSDAVDGDSGLIKTNRLTPSTSCSHYSKGMVYLSLGGTLMRWDSMWLRSLQPRPHPHSPGTSPAKGHSTVLIPMPHLLTGKGCTHDGGGRLPQKLCV